MRPIPTWYDGNLFESMLEARWAVFFNNAGIPYEYEYFGHKLGEQERTWYLPDFWLPEHRTWVEVKPYSEFKPQDILKMSHFEVGLYQDARSTRTLLLVAMEPGLCEVPWEDVHTSMSLECSDMGETAREEYANLYTRGVSEAAGGLGLDAQDVLDALEAFGGDGGRWYPKGVLEGIEERVEQEIEEYEILEASIAYAGHESSVSILEESEDALLSKY